MLKQIDEKLLVPKSFTIRIGKKIWYFDVSAMLSKIPFIIKGIIQA